ncbi:MAG: ATP-binding protein [Anaerolineae bacterium]|nr:ATP-binding protein [Anaerolineae bacterium]
MVQKTKPKSPINQLVKMLNAWRDESIQDTLAYIYGKYATSPDALRKWRQAKHRPDAETLIKLVELGVKEARLDRAWARDTLNWGHVFPIDPILAELFSPSQSGTRHNLHQRPLTEVVGRITEIATLMEWLCNPRSTGGLLITGMGGIGKSALALEAAWRCVEHYPEAFPEERFEAVIWLPIQPTLLTTQGIAPALGAYTQLADMYGAIVEILTAPAAFRSSAAISARPAYTALRTTGRTLLILDGVRPWMRPRCWLSASISRPRPNSSSRPVYR